MKFTILVLALFAVAAVADITAPANGAHYVTWAAVASEEVDTPKASEFCVKFKAQGSNDAHILVSSKSGVERIERAYEIVLGGWGNTKSVIRVGTQGEAKDTFPLNPYVSGDVLSAKEARSFWISIVDGEVNAGRGTRCYADVIMTATFVMATDKNYFNDIQHIAFGAWDTPVVFSNIAVHNTESNMKQFNVPGNGRLYTVFNRPNDIKLNSDAFEIVFQARGDAATIGFLPSYEPTAENALEFVLDANNGTRTEIWKGTRASGKASLVAAFPTKNLVDFYVYHTFWISKYGDAVAIGKGKQVGVNAIAAGTVPDLGLDEFIVGWTAKDYPTSYIMISHESQEMLDDDVVDANLSDYFDAITENKMETEMIKGGSKFNSKLYEQWQSAQGDKTLSGEDEESWINLQYKLAAEGNPTAIAIMKGTYPKPTAPKETAAQWEADNYLEISSEAK